MYNFICCGFRGVGCIFFEMATGRPFFPGSTVEDQLHLIFKVSIYVDGRFSFSLRKDCFSGLSARSVGRSFLFGKSAGSSFEGSVVRPVVRSAGHSFGRPAFRSLVVPRVGCLVCLLR